jgi:hypothetical protein
MDNCPVEWINVHWKKMSSRKNECLVKWMNVQQKVFLRVNLIIKVQLYPSYCPYKNLMINGLKFKVDMFEISPLCVALYLLSDLAARVSLSSARYSTVTLKASQQIQCSGSS